MKTGTKIKHIYNLKARGMIVALVGSDQARVLWNTENMPRLHPLSVLVPAEADITTSDVEPESTDEPEAEDSSGVSELSLEIVTETEDEVEEPAETVADPEDVIESEVIGE